MTAAEFIFWTAIGVVVYTYAGYPLTIVFLSIFFNQKVEKLEIEPKVSILISAYNEEKNIERKLKNSFALDYPGKKMEIMVASDGSNDATDDIVRNYGNNDLGVRVVLHRVEGRLGKTATQNSAVNVCRGDIIVFSDAASMYDSGAIKAIVRNYNDQNVGAVSGMYQYTNEEGTSAGRATSIFWNFENFIKKRQSCMRTITGCCGCIYSVRKELYQQLPATIISDLVEPLTILQKGYRIVFEPEALAFEEPAGDTGQEFKMRIRVIVRGMTGMLFVKNLLNPLKYPYISFQLISHKILRWLVSLFAILIFISNLIMMGRSPFYSMLFLGQVLFYSFALLGYIFEKKGMHWKVFYLPLYFCTVNLASLISMYKVMRKENIVTWQTMR